MEPLEYLRLQMLLEGKGIIGDNLLIQTEAVPGEEMPLMLLAQLADQKLIVYYSNSMSPHIQKKLAACVQEITFPNINPILNTMLSYHNLQPEVEHYKTYVFPVRFSEIINTDVICFSKSDPKIQAFGFGGFAKQVYAMEHEGRVVSACVSTREDEHCGEAWVYTDPEYRNRGMARRVVSTWARSLMDSGKVPFYSHEKDNAASANLAGALDLIPVFEEITIK
jgi:hypothetical protein